MSSIDLVILGIVLEKPQSAYDIQKDVEYHHFSRWTKISVPSIYRKVLQLSEKGYLQSDIVKGDKFADKAIYSITDRGRAYFKELMASCAAGPVPLLFDFNVVITNLNKMDKAEAVELVSALRQSIQSSAMRGNLQTFPWMGERFLNSSSFSIVLFWNGWITLKGSSWKNEYKLPKQFDHPV